LTYDVVGHGNIVKKVRIEEGNYIIEADPGVIKMDIMPDLKGLSVREALRLIDFTRIRVFIDGDGIVKKQSIKKGSAVRNGTSLYLTCN